MATSYAWIGMTSRRWSSASARWHAKCAHVLTHELLQPLLLIFSPLHVGSARLGFERKAGRAGHPASFFSSFRRRLVLRGLARGAGRGLGCGRRVAVWTVTRIHAGRSARRHLARGRLRPLDIAIGAGLSARLALAGLRERSRAGQ